MNNIEVIEAAIEAKMEEIDAYEGIKRPNSFYLLAQLLDRYSEMCVLSAENKVITAPQGEG